MMPHSDTYFIFRIFIFLYKGPDDVAPCSHHYLPRTPMSIPVCGMMDSPFVALCTIMMPFLPLILSVFINSQWRVQKEAEYLLPDA